MSRQVRATEQSQSPKQAKLVQLKATLPLAKMKTRRERTALNHRRQNGLMRGSQCAATGTPSVPANTARTRDDVNRVGHHVEAQRLTPTRPSRELHHSCVVRATTLRASSLQPAFSWNQQRAFRGWLAASEGAPYRTRRHGRQLVDLLRKLHHS